MNGRVTGDTICLAAWTVKARRRTSETAQAAELKWDLRLISWNNIHLSHADPLTDRHRWPIAFGGPSDPELRAFWRGPVRNHVPR